ncbi:MAG: DUF1501 domain-containing protein [Dehalococcoidia bacterium]|nr:MAG: DUF1501 domain-containing protein [Dehalococcoidia bacterium]
MLTRRDFVKRGVALVTLGTMHAALPPVFKGAFAVRASDADAAIVDTPRTLVIVQLAGGNDGLNTVVPYRDPAYARLRPSLGVDAAQVVQLGDDFGLHPQLAALKPLWDGKQLAIVHGVGYPEPNFSHFQSMLIWQSGGPGAAAGEGWLGAYLARLEAEEHDPLHGFNVDRLVAPELYSPRAPIVSAPDAASYGFQKLAPDEAEARRRQTALLKLYEQFPKNTPYAALLESTADDAVSSSAAVTSAVAAHTPSVTYPKTSLASGLQLVAQVIASGAKLRVAHVTLGGFDTHSAQLNEHERLLGELGGALAAFYADLASMGRDGDVLTMTWSEFGRRAGENASEGTDHGTAAPMFVIGGTVNGGFYGTAPSLDQLDSGNLRFTTDFRSVYASVLDGWVGAPADEILGARYERVEGLLG